MPEQTNKIEYYKVSSSKYDIPGGLEPGDARRRYFTKGRTAHGNVRAVENGQAVRVKYRVGKGCFFWKKTSGKATLQEAFRLPGGAFRIVVHNFSGRLHSALTYDAGLHWVQTSYYNGNPASPVLVLKRQENGILRTEPGEAGVKAETLLLPCPYSPGTAAQSYVNAEAGEPDILAETDAGTFCFCTEEELAKRQSLAQRLQDDPARLTPEWAVLPEEDLSFQVIENDGSSERRAMAENPVQSPAESAAEKKPQHPVPRIPSERDSGHPAKYAVAARGLRGGVRGGVPARREAEKTPESAAAEEKEKPGKPPPVREIPPEEGVVPAERIVVSGMESYLYFGRLQDGLREGFGRTQGPGGRTAYEGGYHCGLREGFGVYYYKSGRLCYVGGWKQNLRNGLGVAFGAGDGSIFVGRWENGSASGCGTEFSPGGSLLYTGGWKNGRRNGFGTEFGAGRVKRAGIWKNGVLRMDLSGPGQLPSR